MKKILLLFLVIIFPLFLIAQDKTGIGWKNVPAKQNFKDDINAAKKFYIRAVELTSTPAQLNNVDISSPLQALLNAKQATLVAGTNIKTINGVSPLGSGNMVISGGGSMTWPSSGGITVYSGSNTWGTSITNNSSNWNTAYGWGNHASAGYASLTNPSFNTRITTPTLTLGQTVVTSTADELNLLHGVSNIMPIGSITSIPTIYSSATDTSAYPVPGKVGNIYVNTANGDVYVSIKPVRHDGWVKIN